MKKFTIAFISVILVFLMGFSVVAEFVGTSSAMGDSYMKTENLALQNKSSISDGKDKTVYHFMKKSNDDVVIDLGEEKVFNNIILKEKGLNVKKFSLSYSNDGKEFTEFFRSDKIEFHRLCTFEPVSARYIKLTILESDMLAKIREIEVYNELPEQRDDFRVVSYGTIGGSIYDIIDDASIDESQKDIEIQKLINKDYFKTITDYIIIGNISWDENGEILAQGWDGILRDENKYFGRMMKNLHYVLDDTDTNIVLTILNPVGEGGAEKVMKSITQNRDNLITNMIEFANRYQLDGIDLDWEFPLSDEEFDAYNSFLQELKHRMDKEMWNKEESTLSIAVATWALKYTQETIDCIDYVNVMGYDILDQDGEHSSFFSSCVQAADYIETQGFTKEQINIGYPFYGTYMHKNMEQYGYNSIEHDKIDEFENIYTMVKSDTGENRETYFNSPSMIRDKTAYSYLKGYGGVMIFSLYCDINPNDDLSLTKAIQNYLDEVAQK